MSRLLRCLIAVIVVCIFLSPAMGQQGSSPTEYVAAIFVQALTENGNTPAIQSLPRSEHDLRKVISTNLKPQLLLRSVELSGTTYRFTGSKGIEEVTIIMLRYPSLNLCAKNKASIEQLKSYFAKSEMLTRFSATQLGKLLVLVSSENSGDARIVAAIDSLPARLADYMKDHPSSRIEGKPEGKSSLLSKRSRW